MSFIEDCFRPSPLAELFGPLNGSVINQLPRPKTSEEEVRLRAMLQLPQQPVLQQMTQMQGAPLPSSQQPPYIRKDNPRILFSISNFEIRYKGE